MLQSFHLLPRLTALENVRLRLTYRGSGSAQAERRARQVVDRVGMGDRVGHRPDDLSSRQQQRGAIAQTLVGERAWAMREGPATEARERHDRLVRGAITRVLTAHARGLDSREEDRLPAIIKPRVGM